MPYMLEGRMIGHLWVHHGVIGLRCAAVLASFVRSVFIIFIIIVRACMLIRKVLWSLVFVRAAIVLEPPDYIVDIRRRVFVQLLVVAKDDDGDIDGAEDGEFVRLLEETAFALEEGDAAVAVVADRFNLDLTSAHDVLARRQQC